MSDAGGREAAWMRPADRPILEFLAAKRAHYPAIVANRTGMHVPYVERRCRELAARGLVETVSDEVVYRITADGKRVLDGSLDPATLPRTDE